MCRLIILGIKTNFASSNNLGLPDQENYRMSLFSTPGDTGSLLRVGLDADHDGSATRQLTRGTSPATVPQEVVRGVQTPRGRPLRRLALRMIADEHLVSDDVVEHIRGNGGARSDDANCAVAFEDRDSDLCHAADACQPEPLS